MYGTIEVLILSLTLSDMIKNLIVVFHISVKILFITFLTCSVCELISEYKEKRPKTPPEKSNSGMSSDNNELLLVILP